MDLKSIAYVVFAAIVAIAYYPAGRFQYGQRIVLLCANLFFILAASGVKSLLIIAACVAISYLAGLLIEKNLERKKTARRIFWLDVILSLAILCYFKFFRDSFEAVRLFFSHRGISISTLVSPIGISYFTLTMIAYA
ncbi:MAG TPA: hypothetical protein DDY87_01525, partial [Clostridiales bacterium]|nr:hypothetical protein [Clostridiales bacterium]